MPYRVFLEADPRCPACRAKLDDLYGFSWGYCRGQHSSTASRYHVGDQLRWRRCGGNLIPAWAAIEPSVDGLRAANIGDPAIADLVVIAGPSVEWGVEPHCGSCATPYGGLAVPITGGVVGNPRVLAVGELPIWEATDYLRDRDGALAPQRDWESRELVEVLCTEPPDIVIMTPEGPRAARAP